MQCKNHHGPGPHPAFAGSRLAEPGRAGPDGKRTAKRSRPALTAAACIAAGLLCAASAPAQLTPDQLEQLSTHFGFGDMEIYKLDKDIRQLNSADMNNDGLRDLIVANNSKGKIEVLLQRRENVPVSRKTSSDVNELETEGRFERRFIPINYKVTTMVVAELTGDDLPDIAFFGEPKELVVLPNTGAGRFGVPVVQRVRDGMPRKGTLAAGDLNGDGRIDLALLGEKDVLFFYHNTGGGLGRPVYSAHATNQPFTLDVSDIDGDGRDDMVIVTGGTRYYANVRLQNATGELGPQIRIKLPRLKSYELLNVLGRKQADLVGVEEVSGRLRRWQFDFQKRSEGSDEWPVLFHAFPESKDTTRRALDVGDVNGDGRADIVTTDPQAAQLLLLCQNDGGGLKPPARFGGQVNMRDLKVHDLDSDGHQDVLVCSADEKAIGISRWLNGRLTFPRPIPVVGTPHAFDVLARRPPWHTLVYVTEQDDAYHLVTQSVKAEMRNDELVISVDDDRKQVKIEEYNTAPSAVRFADANQDGRMDVLIFAPYEPLITFVQDEQGDYQRLEGASTQQGLVKDATSAGFHVADVTGDGKAEILLAQRSFARALRIRDGAWMVVDQFDAPTASSEITGVCTFKEPGQQRPSVALYDKRNAEVHWLTRQSEGTYGVTESIPVGSFELSHMTTTFTSGEAAGEVLLSDVQKFALLLPHKPALRAVEKAVYETKTKDGRLFKPAVGDLNHDGRTDVVVTEARENRLEILTFGPDEQLVLATAFKVFDTKQFSRGKGESIEPREILIDDFNDDGRDDVAVIVHDRVIIYPSQ